MMQPHYAIAEATEKPDFKPPRYLTVAQTARELQVCRETVYGWVRAGSITFLRLPGMSIRIPYDAIEDFRCPAKEAHPNSSTSQAAESFMSNGPRQAAAEQRSRARASKVMPMPRRMQHSSG